MGAQGGIAGVQGGAGREGVVHEEDMAGRCKDRCGRFRVKPGMTRAIKSRLRGAIKPGRMETIKPGRSIFVMADLDRPSGGKVGQEAEKSSNQARTQGESVGDLEGRGDVPGLLLDRKAGLGAGATGTDEKVGTAGGLG